MIDWYAKFAFILNIKQEASKTLGVDAGQMPTFLGRWGIQVHSFSVRKYLGRKVWKPFGLLANLIPHYFLNTACVSWLLRFFAPVIISNTNLSSHKIYFEYGGGDKLTCSCPEPRWQDNLFLPRSGTCWPTFCVPTDGRQSSNVCASLPSDLKCEVLGPLFHTDAATA